MRRLFVVLVMLLGVLGLATQAVAGAAARYEDCCLHGCEEMSQCAAAACASCAAPQAAPPATSPTLAAAQAPIRRPDAPRFTSAPRREPWTPPD